MKKLDYIVIILNYNTALDAINAAQSIINNATSDNYLICIIDGSSTKKEDVSILSGAELPYTEKIFLTQNKGYAYGNNEAFRRLISKYEFEYTVIMNPDVEITIPGTIEALIETIGNSSNIDIDVVGAQPLVNNIDSNIAPNMQVNARKAFSYIELLVNGFWLFKRLFRSIYRSSVYLNQAPYREKMIFDVPSGAFFIIKSEVFKKVGMFDERTFLYAEEIILGYKLRSIKAAFILNPDYIVNHYQGKATGSHGTEKTLFSLKCEFDSNAIYARYYLCASSIQIQLIKLVMYAAYYSKKIMFKCFQR